MWQCSVRREYFKATTSLRTLLHLRDFLSARRLWKAHGTTSLLCSSVGHHHSHTQLYLCMTARRRLGAHLNAKEDVDVGVLKLVDHLGRPSVVQEVYVLEPVPPTHQSVTGNWSTALQAQHQKHLMSQ